MRPAPTFNRMKLVTLCWRHFFFHLKPVWVRGKWQAITLPVDVVVWKIPNARQTHGSVKWWADHRSLDFLSFFIHHPHPSAILQAPYEPSTCVLLRRCHVKCIKSLLVFGLVSKRRWLLCFPTDKRRIQQSAKCICRVLTPTHKQADGSKTILGTSSKSSIILLKERISSLRVQQSVLRWVKMWSGCEHVQHVCMKDEAASQEAWEDGLK